MRPVQVDAQQQLRVSARAVLFAFLKLGLLSFGGPVAHLGYFRNEFVQRRKWLEDAEYADLVALCQFLPGPASSQVGMAIGLRRAGILGALAAWTGFTLPSAVLMCAFGFGVRWLGADAQAGWLHGLKIAAVAVVAQAVWGMGRSACADAPRVGLMLAAAAAMLVSRGTIAQLGVLACAGVFGWLLLRKHVTPRPHLRAVAALPFSVSNLALLVYFALLALLPLAARMTHVHAVELMDSFYRTGALVFGGGHVILPLLRAEVVPPGWISESAFLAGYGAAQAVPGPLFTFAAYLGTAMQPAPAGVPGALLCLVSIFLPGLLLVIGALPYWDRLRGSIAARAAILAVNAAVVGILLAALIDPIGTSAIVAPRDAVVALCALVLLTVLKAPPVVVVLLCALAGQVLALV
jgi:chromate transporter